MVLCVRVCVVEQHYKLCSWRKSGSVEAGMYSRMCDGLAKLKDPEPPVNLLRLRRRSSCFNSSCAQFLSSVLSSLYGRDDRKTARNPFRDPGRAAHAVKCESMRTQRGCFLAQRFQVIGATCALCGQSRTPLVVAHWSRAISDDSTGSPMS